MLHITILIEIEVTKLSNNAACNYTYRNFSVRISSDVEFLENIVKLSKQVHKKQCKSWKIFFSFLNIAAKGYFV